MHPRNRYRENKPDFRELAEHRPSLRLYLIQKQAAGPSKYPYTLDFSNPLALRELACAVLSKDFGLDVVLPEDRLVPMVPQRLNYIHWLEDLLAEEGGKVPQGDGVCGVDIGTGASCIYPLLGSKMNNWCFLATEIDDHSLRCAYDNVTRNGLQDKISVIKVPTDVTLIGALQKDQHYSFVMCNPPFFENQQEKYEGHDRTPHRPRPSTFSTGSEGETVTGGGEVGFVRRILEDSLRLRTQIRWYSSMLGKKSSLKIIHKELQHHQVSVVTSTEFVQGKTHRWGIAWSFSEDQAPKTLVSTATKRRTTKHGPPLTLPVAGSEGSPEGLRRVVEHLLTHLRELEIQFSEVASSAGCVQLQCEAYRNTWSQQRKKRRLLQKLQALKHTQTGGMQSSENLSMGDTQSEVMQSTPSERSEVRDRAGESGEKTASRPVAETQVESGCSDGETASCSNSEKVAQITSGAEAPPPLNLHPSSSESPAVSSGVIGECNLPKGSASLQSVEEDIWMKIEALKTPCYLQFTCTVSNCEETHDSPSEKQKKLEAEGKETQKHSAPVVLIFEWIQGDNKDLLHQIVQYLKNTMTAHIQ